jgi:hypothetical protein
MNLQQSIQQLETMARSAHAKIGALGQADQMQQQNDLKLQQQVERMQREYQNLAQSLSRLEAQRSGDPEHIRYIEQIPGRRIPFDLIVTIPVGANVTAQQQQATTISQDGPFVAVARYATFQSAHQFYVTDPETGSRSAFQGRSYGRFRPIHSAWDLNDGQMGYQPVVGQAFPGLGEAIFASPSNQSSFRSMEFDGTINFQNQGSGFMRQNSDIPSAFYTNEINSPFPLGALDFFERGEVLQWKVTPLHMNNPPAGNVSAFATGGFYPFVNSQYDVQEGIVDPYILDQTTDPVDRIPDGFLIIGFHGYRIIQPPGVVSLI